MAGSSTIEGERRGHPSSQRWRSNVGDFPRCKESAGSVDLPFPVHGNDRCPADLGLKGQELPVSHSIDDTLRLLEKAG